MQRNFSTFSLTGALALAATTLAGPGCGGPATTPVAPTAPAESVTLTVACPAGAPKTLFETYGAAAAKRVGVKVRVAVYDPKDGPESAAGADLWVTRPADLPRLADAGRLRPVPEDVSGRGRSYRWQELLSAYTDRLLLWKGEAYGLPVLGESPLCFYRADLLGDAAHKEGFRKAYGRELAAPAAWEDFADIAEYFHRHLRPNAITPSLPPLPDGDDLGAEFCTVAASTAVRAVRLADRGSHGDAETFSFPYDLATGAPRVAAPGFVHALRLLQRLQPFRAAATGRPAPQAFAAGNAVLCLADASWIARFQKSPAKPAFGVCRVPGSRVVFDDKSGAARAVVGGNYVPYLGAGSWLGVVPKEGRDPAAAFALLADLGGDDTSRRVLVDPTVGGGALRTPIDARGWSAFDLDQAQTHALVSALQQTLSHPGLSNPATCLRLPDAREHERELDAELREALANGKDAAKALGEVDARWRERDERKGPGRARADYALSLGLPPQ